MIKGIDVSAWQGEISWPDAAPNIQFAIIRGGDGTYRDRYLARNVAGAVSAGVQKVEVYHYLRWGLDLMQMAEACYETHNTAVREGMPTTNRLWLDCEDQETILVPANRNIAWLHGLISLLKIPVGLYSALWWWKPYMANTGVFNTIPLWAAAYPFGNQVPPDDYPLPNDGPALFGGWDSWLVWQYSSSGNIPGINGRVDLNVAQDSYMGGGNMPENQIGDWTSVNIRIPAGEHYAYVLIPGAASGHVYAHATIQEFRGSDWPLQPITIQSEALSGIPGLYLRPEVDAPVEHELTAVVAVQRVR